MLACLALFSLPSHCETPAAPVMTESIDETRTLILHGNVHPLAQAQYERATVDDSLAAKRVLSPLNRPAEGEAALQKFLTDVHRRGSGSYHGHGGGIRPPPPSTSTYSVLVSGSANGILHHAKADCGRRVERRSLLSTR